MTVRKRLFLSNLLMILVPVVATALIGVLCVSLIWFSLLHGSGFGADDREDFAYASMAVSETVERTIERNGDLSSLEGILDGDGMALKVLEGDRVFFSYGKEASGDRELMAAAEALGEGSTITRDGRSLYIHSAAVDENNYTICVFGGSTVRQDYYDLKTAIGAAAGIIALTVVLSIWLTNRFLIRFVFKKIEEPLDILTDGVRQIRDGNLDYRIDYVREDEFRPVCDDFNEMALRLKESVERVQKQERSRKELIAGISHDIRSPLTSIQAYVEGLIDGIARTPEKKQEYLHTIKNKAEDLEHIVSQLFLFSKMELGEYPERMCLMNLDETVTETVEGIREEYREKGLDIHMDLIPARIWGDTVQVKRIVSNIIENSLKYKKKERGNIFIRLTLEEKWCSLSFADDGPGVPEEAVPHIFEVFYRSDPARKEPHKGSGLGLAIVANAVEHMEGTIRAENRKEGGLEICIRFPVKGEKDGQDTDN